jgi:hypothetical protein
MRREQLPIVGLTAGFQHSEKMYYENDVGMNGCLGKPLPMDALKKALAQYQSHQQPPAGTNGKPSVLPSTSSKHPRDVSKPITLIDYGR